MCVIFITVSISLHINLQLPVFYLLLSIIFSVALLLNFRLFPRFGVNTTHAIALNYFVCFLTGWLLMPSGQRFQLNFSENWTWYCLALGIGFIVTFLLSGKATQSVGMTATSLVNNISLVIPVLASLFLFKSTIRFDVVNYLGLALAFVALVLVSIKSEDKKMTAATNGGLLLLAVFVLYGLTNTAINYLNIEIITTTDQTIPVTLVMIFGASLAGSLLLGYQVFIKKEMFKLNVVWASITLGVPNFLSFYFLILTLSFFQNSGAFVYPLYNVGVILASSFVGIVFFKEKLSTLNYTGLLVAILAILLISYQSILGEIL